MTPPTSVPPASPRSAKRPFRGRWPVTTSMRVMSARATVSVKSLASLGRTTSVSGVDATMLAGRGSSPSDGALMRTRLPTARELAVSWAAIEQGASPTNISSAITVRMAASEVRDACYSLPLRLGSTYVN
jgi:hypothetical protein